MGIKVPIFGSHTRFGQPIYLQRPESLASIGSLRAEVSELSKRIEGILDKIDSLGRKREKR